MGTHNRIAAESSRLHRLFTLGAGRVSLTGETLHVDGLLGGGPRKIPVGAIDSITVRPSWFWHRLTIRLGDGTERSIGGLDKKEAVRVRDATIEGAVRVAKALRPHLNRLDERLRQHFAGDCYARYSDSRKLHETLAGCGKTLLSTQGRKLSDDKRRPIACSERIIRIGLSHAECRRDS